MREFRTVLRDAGPRLWLSAVAGLVAGLAEAAVLVLAVAAAVALSDGKVATIHLPFRLSDSGAGALVVAGFVCAIVRIGASLAGLRLATTAKSAVEARYQSELLRAFLEGSWEAVAARPEGELQELTGGQAPRAASAVLHTALALQAALTFAVLMASSVLVGPAAVAASVVGATLLALVLRPIARASAKASKRRMRHDFDVAALTAESVRLAEEVAVFGVGSVQAERGGRMIEQKRSTGAAAEFAAELTPVAYQGAVFVVVFIGLGLLVAFDVAVGPTLGVIVVLLLRAFSYSQIAQSSYAKALAALSHRDAVIEATNALTQSKPSASGLPLDEIATCDVVGVSYAYPSGHRALDDVSFTLRHGDALGVTGPSGAGKSTLVQVLLRLRAPTTGTYLVNGRAAADYDRHDWATATCLVPQEPKLIEGTIADNIRFLRDGITDEQVARATRLAGLEGDVRGFAEGLDRPVGPRHRALSGGQAQRVAIARALAGEPSLLVLDEPTSALDIECEQVIQETLESLKGLVTVVVITHRPSTLERCDRILTLRDGRVEATQPPTSPPQQSTPGGDEARLRQ